MSLHVHRREAIDDAMVAIRAVGGFTLSLATAIKVVSAVARGAAGEAEWGEAAGFAAAIFGMGFLCGVIVWAGKGLHRRLGMVGDAIVGVAVMLAFFVSCMLLFDPEMLRAKFSSGGGAFMLGLAVVIGLISGAWIGHDLRKDASSSTEQLPQPRRRHESKDNPFDL